MIRKGPAELDEPDSRALPLGGVQAGVSFFAFFPGQDQGYAETWGLRRRTAASPAQWEEPARGETRAHVPADRADARLWAPCGQATATPTEINTEAPAARTSAASDLRRPLHYDEAGAPVERIPLTDCAEGSPGLPHSKGPSRPRARKPTASGPVLCAIPGTQITQQSSRKRQFPMPSKVTSPKQETAVGRRNSLRPGRRLDTHDQSPGGGYGDYMAGKIISALEAAGVEFTNGRRPGVGRRGGGACTGD